MPFADPLDPDFFDSVAVIPPLGWEPDALGGAKNALANGIGSQWLCYAQPRVLDRRDERMASVLTDKDFDLYGPVDPNVIGDQLGVLYRLDSTGQPVLSSGRAIVFQSSAIDLSNQGAGHWVHAVEID